MKKFTIFTFLFIISFNAFSSGVKIRKAETVAKNFLTEQLKTAKKPDLNLLSTEKSKNRDNLFYIFNFSRKPGFIIISGNDNVYPILAYSTESNYKLSDTKPDAFTDWMQSLKDQIIFVTEQKIKANKKIQNLWIYYSNPDFKPAKKNTKDVSPLLTTTWNQGCGYNALCPETSTGGSCGHVWTGCVATAMAQVMKYNNFPVSGEGSHSYTHYVYGEQSADFENTIYDWANMPDGSGNAEVAKLMYHCGVAVNMDYGPSGSGAYSSTAASALKTYFKYSRNLILTSKYSYTEDNWARLMRAEIDSGRPMYYQGRGSSGGHAFVLDGYQGTDFFHFNWGWGGSYNGYFYLNDLTPGGYSFTSSQGAIVGIQPRDSYPGLDCSNPVILSSGIPFNGTTVGSANITNFYGSYFYYQETGKEVVHQITTSYPGRISASITNLNGNNLDVFILSYCNQDSLLAYGDSVAFADNTDPGTYLIVVDGRYAAEGTYTLTVNAPDNNPDLIITDQSVNPDFSQASDLAYISFTEKNIGNNNAGTSKTKLYYSEDNIFDGSDIYLKTVNMPNLNAGEEHKVMQSITVPASATPGTRYIFFVADADNEVIETDENLNTENASFNIVAPGIMDCSSAVSLSDNIWYFGNTETDGQNNIDNYSWGYFPDKEVIHSISSTYNGVADIQFTEKIPGNLTVLVLSTCNENACINNLGIWSPEDTLSQTSLYMYAGITYYFVVDGEENVSGNYGIKVNTPGACPEPEISYWGSPDLCTGQGINLSVSWEYNEAQWYKNNILLDSINSTNIWVTEAGSYKAQVTENGCSAFTEPVTVRINDAPLSALISAQSDTVFCEGGNVSLNLTTGNGYSVQWLKNGKDVNGETALSYTADQSGIYSAKVTNISCSILSNEIKVKANPAAPDINDFVRVNDSALTSWFSCDYNDNTDLSGHGNDYFYSGWNYAEDRHGEWIKSAFFNGQWDNITTTNSFNNPNNFSMSLWFKTKSTNGGFLIGLGDNQWGESTVCDRVIYLDDAGKLYFGVIDGTAKTISTTTAYNDDVWHNVIATLSADGMKLYVDGTLQANDNTVTNGSNFTGWWKIAHDIIDPNFPNIPSSNYFNGTLDDIKIYERALLPGEADYMFNENKLFDVSINGNNFCGSGASSLQLNNTTAFVEYQLRNDADNSLVGTAVTGNANTINLPAGTLTETRTFNISATNTADGCSKELSDLFTITINDLPAATLSGDAEICENETADITINLTGTAPWNISYTDGTNTFSETTSDNPYIFTVSDAGTYALTALSDANCTGSYFSGTANITVNALPTVFIGNDTTILTSDTLILDAGAGFSSYIWNDNSTEQTLTIYGSILGAGNYDFSVTVEDAHTCENSDTINVSIENPLSVNLNGKNSILIYPNPTNGIFFIKGINPDNINSVSITTIEGKIIKEVKPNSENTEINLQNFPSGIYFVRIRNKKNERFYFKILKQQP